MASSRLVVDQVLRRFEREARRGECSTGRYRCSYYDWGRGAPLVFIPGLLDDADSFVLVAAGLAEHFRCVAYDLPTGRGDGARLRRYTHEDLVADLFALLDHLKIEQSYLFGSSFGSTIALAALHAQPGRFPRAILQGGFARRPLAPAEALLARIGRYLPGTMGALPLHHRLLQRLHGGPFEGQSPEIWDYFVARSNAPPIAAACQRALLLHHVDLRPLLSEIRQPILLICGDADPRVDTSCEQVLLEGLASADRIELANCGHNPMFSHPEVLAEIVRRFLTPPDATKG
jgi:pimeloyl-ACP methyl ester carboxylesterase